MMAISLLSTELPNTILQHMYEDDQYKDLRIVTRDDKLLLTHAAVLVSVSAPIKECLKNEYQKDKTKPKVKYIYEADTIDSDVLSDLLKIVYLGKVEVEKNVISKIREAAVELELHVALKYLNEHHLQLLEETDKEVENTENKSNESAKNTCYEEKLAINDEVAQVVLDDDLPKTQNLFDDDDSNGSQETNDGMPEGDPQCNVAPQAESCQSELSIEHYLTKNTLQDSSSDSDLSELSLEHYIPKETQPNESQYMSEENAPQIRSLKQNIRDSCATSEDIVENEIHMSKETHHTGGRNVQTQKSSVDHVPQIEKPIAQIEIDVDSDHGLQQISNNNTLKNTSNVTLAEKCSREDQIISNKDDVNEVENAVPQNSLPTESSLLIDTQPDSPSLLSNIDVETLKSQNNVFTEQQRPSNDPIVILDDDDDDIDDVDHQLNADDGNSCSDIFDTSAAKSHEKYNSTNTQFGYTTFTHNSNSAFSSTESNTTTDAAKQSVTSADGTQKQILGTVSCKDNSKSATGIILNDTGLNIECSKSTSGKNELEKGPIEHSSVPDFLNSNSHFNLATIGESVAKDSSTPSTENISSHLKRKSTEDVGVFKQPAVPFKRIPHSLSDNQYKPIPHQNDNIQDLKVERPDKEVMDSDTDSEMSMTFSPFPESFSQSSLSWLGDMSQSSTCSQSTKMYPHRCRTCGKGFRTQNDLKNHMSKYDKRTLEKIALRHCGLCMQSYETVHSFVEHYRSHAKEAFICKRCRYHFSNYHALLDHYNLTKGSCVLKWKPKMQLPKTNIDTTGGMKSLPKLDPTRQLKLMGKKLELKDCLNFQCNKCPYMIPNKKVVELFKHFKEMHSCGVPCPGCNHVYLTNSPLRKHILSKHFEYTKPNFPKRIEKQINPVLEGQIKAICQQVAAEPQQARHSETGTKVSNASEIPEVAVNPNNRDIAHSSIVDHKGVSGAAHPENVRNKLQNFNSLNTSVGRIDQHSNHQQNTKMARSNSEIAKRLISSTVSKIPQNSSLERSAPHVTESNSIMTPQLSGQSSVINAITSGGPPSSNQQIVIGRNASPTVTPKFTSLLTKAATPKTSRPPRNDVQSVIEEVFSGTVQHVGAKSKSAPNFKTVGIVGIPKPQSANKMQTNGKGIGKNKLPLALGPSSLQQKNARNNQGQGKKMNMDLASNNQQWTVNRFCASTTAQNPQTNILAGNKPPSNFPKCSPVQLSSYTNLVGSKSSSRKAAMPNDNAAHDNVTASPICSQLLKNDDIGLSLSPARYNNQRKMMNEYRSRQSSSNVQGVTPENASRHLMPQMLFPPGKEHTKNNE